MKKHTPGKPEKMVGEISNVNSSLYCQQDVLLEMNGFPTF